ncbi:MAG: type II secretion system GspH family protein [Cephaloticoccus sp.]|nr:type II secretion system GspH family protein [Cephaloticoccus sp.]MCF7759484.1 type II secretion system GspH family protein [Cephaloticoccus sp.]
MKSPQFNRHGGLASSKPTGVGGFTVIEIAIVVSVVGIISWVAVVALQRIGDVAARTVIANNLRQLYQAKEYYFSETRSTDLTSVATLAEKGYIKDSLNDQFQSMLSFEGGKGWHYSLDVMPNQPVYAYQGSLPANSAPTGEVIYYPAEPGSLDDLFGAGAAVTAPPVTPDVVTPVAPTDPVTTTPPPPSSGPGNSDFGHSQGKGKDKDKDKDKD